MKTVSRTRRIVRSVRSKRLTHRQRRQKYIGGPMLPKSK